MRSPATTLPVIGMPPVGRGGRAASPGPLLRRRAALFLALLTLTGTVAVPPAASSLAPPPLDIPSGVSGKGSAEALLNALATLPEDPAARGFALARLALEQRAPDAPEAFANLGVAEAALAALDSGGLDAAADAALAARAVDAPADLAPGIAATRVKLAAVPALLDAAAGPGGPLDRAVAAAGLAGDLQARLVGLPPLADAPLVLPVGPRAAAEAVLARWAVVAESEQVAALEALDAADEPLRGAVTRFLAAYLAYDSATQAALDGADPAAISAALAWLQSQLPRASLPAGTGDVLAPMTDPPPALDFRPVLAARGQLLDAAEELGAAYAATSSASALPELVAPPALVLSWEGRDNTYDERVAVLVDAGGDDLYRNNAGGSNLRSPYCFIMDPPDVLVHVPETGTTLLVPGSSASVPSAGAAALVDLGGDDVYRPVGACGSIGGGFHGAGFLLDAAGNDTYDHQIPSEVFNLLPWYNTDIEGAAAPAGPEPDLASRPVGAGSGSGPEARGHLVGFLEAVPADLALGDAFEGAVVTHVDAALRFIAVDGADVAFGARAAARADVAYVEPNAILHAAEVVPDDPLWPQQYGPRQARVDEAWDTLTGGATKTICILDSGVDTTHPDLAGARWLGGRDFINNDHDPMDDHGHGTHVAGIAVATMNNALGVAGGAQVGFYAGKVLDGDGRGPAVAVVAGIKWCADLGADVISMSFGGGLTLATIEQALTYAAARGALLVAAAGNDAFYVNHPARSPLVMAVACTDAREQLCYFSSRGAEVEIAAPGYGIVSTALTCAFGVDLCHNSRYMKLSGTSMSTPLVSAIAALVWTAAADLTAEQLRQLLRDTATDLGPPGCDEFYGSGLVDAKAALDAALGGARPAWRGATNCLLSYYGLAGGATVGVGLLVDGAGDDTYNGTYVGTVGGAVQGAGLVVDGAGDDAYFAWNSLGIGGALGVCNPGTTAVVNQPVETGTTVAGVVDLGGDDSYTIPQGYVGNGAGACTGAGFLLDAAGNDAYVADDASPGGAPGTNGGSFVRGSSGFLYDAGGDDTYRGGDIGVNGGAESLGVGFLLDRGGVDVFIAGERGVNGGASGTFPGLGFLLAGGEDADTYTGANRANGGGNGLGFLLDEGGDDLYHTVADEGNGGASAGGRGLLLDLAGNDRYKGGKTANGGATGSFGTGSSGLLADLAGDDQYEGSAYGANGGAAQATFDKCTNLTAMVQGGSAASAKRPAVGMLVDAGGDDVYEAFTHGVNGGACGVARGFLLDLAGRDQYRASTQGVNGGAVHNGTALLLDEDGDDLYVASADPPVGANGGGAGGAGMLLDASGHDQYFAGTSAEDPGSFLPSLPGPPEQRDGPLQPDTVPRPDSWSPLVARAGVLGPVAPDTMVRIGVGLELRDRAGLEAFLDEVSHPASPRFQQFLSQEEFNARFGPTPAQEAAVLRWLHGAGFEVTELFPNRLLVVAEGDPAAVQRAFGVTLHRVLLAGVEGFAPLSAPRVPAAVSAFTTGVIGLDDLAPFRPAHTGRPAEAGPDQAAGGTCCAFGPQDVARFYQHSQAFQGAGQTIVLAGSYAWDEADVARFNAEFALPPLPEGSAQVCTASLGPGCFFDPGFSLEVHLDVAMAHGQAPLAAIKNYMARTTNTIDFLTMYNAIVRDDPGHVVSSSWSTCENFSPSTARASDNIIANGAALGQTWFTSSSDQGSRDCGLGSPPGVAFPASSPHVTAVGGTSAACAGGMNGADPDCGGYGAETGWSGTALAGSGGGTSALFAKPAHQAGCAVPPTGARDVPDIALEADPLLPGNWVAHGGAWHIVGGTSASTPAWAGFFAALNERLGGAGLGLAGPRLYDLCPTAAFHDILAGSNGDHAAGRGYDRVAGIGTPVVDRLFQDWLASPRALPGAPEDLRAMGGEGNATLIWTWPFDAGGARVAQYHVYRGATPTELALLTTGGCADLGAVFSCVDDDLPTGQAYFYAVTAVNAVGEGPPSAPVVALTSGVPVDLPVIPQTWGTNGAGDDLGTGLLLDRRGGDVYQSADGGDGIDIDLVPKGTGAQMDLNAPPAAAGRIEAGLVEPWPTDRLTAVHFTDLSSDPDGGDDLAAWAWDFGDGAVGTEQHPTHTYAQLGTFPVRLTVTDGAGDTDTVDVGNVTVLNLAPAARIAPLGEANRVDPYQFQDASTDPDDAVVAWAWDFGDGLATGRPGPPRDLAATAEAAAVHLTWLPPRSAGATSITGYDVFRGSATNGETLLARLGMVTTYTDLAVTEDETHYYQVRAVNADGEGAKSNEARVLVADAPHTFFEDDMESGPGAWVSRQIRPGIGSAWTRYDFADEPAKRHSPDHAWTCGDGASYEPGSICALSHYVDLANMTSLEVRFWHTLEGAGFPDAYGQVSLSRPAENGGAWTCQLAFGLAGIPAMRQERFPVDFDRCPQFRGAANVTLQFYFSANHDAPPAGGWFVDDVQVLGTVTAATEPPRELRAVPGDARAELAWDAPNLLHGANVTGYRVYRGTSSGNVSLLATIEDPEARTYLDENLTNGQEYVYHVATLSAAGESAKSNEVPATPAAVIAGSVERHPEHQYTALGSYNVTLIVADPEGAESAVRTAIQVVNLPPTAAFEVVQDTPMAFTPTQFTDLSTDRDGEVVQWSWDFGDGSTSTERNATHIYLQGGTFNITLTVTDNDGGGGNSTGAERVWRFVRQVFVCAPGLSEESEFDPAYPWEFHFEWQACLRLRDGQVQGLPVNVPLPAVPGLPDLL